MFPAASGGNITPNMVRLHRDRHWDRQLQRKNGVWKYTNARSLLNLIPEKEVEKVLTLFPSHSKLSIPIPSCFQTPNLLCASGGVKGRKEQGLQDWDKTSTAPLTWRSEDGQLWKQGVELWVIWKGCSTSSGGISDHAFTLQSKPNWLEQISGVQLSKAAGTPARSFWDYQVSYTSIIPFTHFTHFGCDSWGRALWIKLKYELDFKKVWNRYWIYWSAMSRKIHW